MTTKSAAAMELTRVDVVLAAVVVVPARTAAVAKKLNDPPIKDATKQAAACAASGPDNCHTPGKARQMKKESKQPAMDPTEAKPKGSARSRTTRAAELVLFLIVTSVALPLAVDSDNSKRASEAGKRVLQQISYTT
jgi:hypothetical protein